MGFPYIVPLQTIAPLIRSILQTLFFLYLPIAGLAQYAPLEKLAQHMRTNLGAAKSIYQAPNGLMWFGMQPGGLVYYNGESLVSFPLEGEADFTASEEVFLVGDQILYLNAKKNVLIFDPLIQEIVGSIPLGESIEMEGNLVYLDYANPNGEPLLWASLPFVNIAGKNYYRILLSKNHQSFEWVTNGVIPLFGYPAMEPLGDGLILKTEEQFLILDQQGKEVRRLGPFQIDLTKIREKNLVSNQKDKLIFAGLAPPMVRKVYGYNLAQEQLTLEFEETKGNGNNGNTALEISGNQLFIHGNHSYARDLDQVQKSKIVASFPERVSTTYRDSMKTYWFGATNGIAKMHPTSTVFRKYNWTRNRMITEDEAGNIYIGADGQHFKVYNPVTDKVRSVRTGVFASFSVNFLDGKVYSSNLCYADENLDKLPVAEIEGLGNSPNIQFIDRNGRLWSIKWQTTSLTIVDLKNNLEVQKVRIPALYGSKTQFNSFYQRPSDGTIWLGTQGSGILVFSEDGTFIERFTSGSASRIPLKSNIVNCFYEDEHGRFWIGHSEGLSCLEEETLRHFVINRDEPAFNLVYGLLPEEGEDNKTGFLWLSTNRGIYRFDIQSEFAMGFMLDEDLMKTEFNRTSFYKAKNGRMYFGSNKNGLFAFYPKEVMTYYDSVRGHNLPILINHFSKFDRETREEIEPVKVPNNMEGIRLRYGDRYFDLSFTVADFRRPEENIYTYKLEGYDEKWKTPSRTGNRVHYENLPPDTYTLHMRGGLFPSVLPENERQLSITVLPPWYRSWWAYLLFTITGLGIILGFYGFQLRRQLERAESQKIKELDQLKTRFYSNITHEFRTPLTVMMGVAENISGHEKERKFLQRNGSRLLRLINQLLDLSKLESHKLEINFIQDNIIPYLQYLTESFSSVAEKKGIELAFESNLSSLTMDYDEDKIQHIIYNLLSNALKFTDRGGKVVLKAREVGGEAPEFMLEIQVTDTGIGITADQLPHIFDRFHQVDSAITRKGEGTGIGLAFTKELVKLLEGSIWAKSEWQKGSVFTIRLPISTTAGPPDKKEPNRKETGNQPFPILEEESISLVTRDFAEQPFPPTNRTLVLVVEDNEDVIAYIESLLSSQYQIAKARNGQEGIDKALELMPDIIISDVMMPEKDGYEVCATLKSDERSSHIPIILLTAMATEQDRFTGLRKGADAYLSKPFNKEELFIRLEKLLELRKALQNRYAYSAETSSSVITIPIENASVEPSLDDQFMQKIREIIDKKIDDVQLDIAYICKSVQLSQVQLFRKMKAMTGMPPMSFVRKVRLHRAKTLLENSDLNISEIAYDLGFTDPNYFSRSFKKEFGIAPSKVRG